MNFVPQVINEDKDSGYYAFNTGGSMTQYSPIVEQVFYSYADKLEPGTVCLFIIPCYELTSTGELTFHMPILINTSLNSGAIERSCPWSYQLSGYNDDDSLLEQVITIFTDASDVLHHKLSAGRRNYSLEYANNDDASVRYIGNGYVQNIDGRILTNETVNDYQLSKTPEWNHASKCDYSEKVVKSLKRMLTRCRKDNLRPVLLTGMLNPIVIQVILLNRRSMH